MTNAFLLKKGDTLHYCFLTVPLKATFSQLNKKRMQNCASEMKLLTSVSFNWQKVAKADLLRLQMNEGNPSPCIERKLCYMVHSFTQVTCNTVKTREFIPKLQKY